jgi:hypothetical protein
MSEVQTMMAGSVPIRNYSGLGAPRRRVRASLCSCSGMVSGPPGCGKTRLFQSCDSCFIINADNSRIPIPEGKDVADIWPWKDEEGISRDSDGTPIQLKFGHIIQKVALLEKLATAGSPRPKVIVFDTLAGMIDLAKAFIVAETNNKIPDSQPRKNWNTIDGRMGWGKMQEMFSEIHSRLVSAGYSVWWTCHVIDRARPKPGTPGELEYHKELTMPAGIESILKWRFDIMVVIESRYKVSKKKVKQGGRTILVDDNRRVFEMFTSHPDYMGMTKAKEGMPELIELSCEDPWSDFEAAYARTESTLNQED